MLALLKKEIQLFFASSIGYLVIGTFLSLSSLFLWLFKSKYNILDYGFAELSSFFNLAPWVLLFLIPAVTMRSFSDEKKQGTLELLLTKPLSKTKIVFGKYLGAYILIFFTLIPTLVYVYSIYQLGRPVGNLDIGATFGSYIGLLFLSGIYVAIGIFTSLFSANQIVTFISSVVICLFFFIGFESLAELIKLPMLENFGINSHYKSMSRGVIDTRDIIYFITILLLFILFTIKKLENKPKPLFKTLTFVLLVSIAAFILNTILSQRGFYKRFDVTQDHRYTLSKNTIDILSELDSPLVIDVFLKGDNFPSEFRRLQNETKQLLEEYVNVNSNIKFNFINPLTASDNQSRNIQQLTKRGLTPMQISIKDRGKTTQEVIFPWALASHSSSNNETFTVKIPLVKNKIGSDQQEIVTNSVQHLEYVFSDGIKKLVHTKQKKIAVLRGNGELETPYIADYLKTIRDYYYIAPFTLDSVALSPQKTLNDLKEFDLILAAKPTVAFTEQEKLVLDQFIMQGGKSLWLIDAVAAEKDSLNNSSGSTVAFVRDLNLTDFFFKYGIRINPILVKDLYSAPLTLAIGEGSSAQFQPLKWHFSPLSNSDNSHPIVSNIDLVKFDFANQIDTLKSKPKKTILLKSSPLTSFFGVPNIINLEEATQTPNPKFYTKGPQNLAVLLEGKFTSVYKNRVLPFNCDTYASNSSPTQMIVIADGDLIKNEVGRSGPQELGFDKWTGQKFGNKEFLLNCTNYLLGDSSLVKIRSKTVDIAFLDQEKIADESLKWQIINILLPLVFLAVFGFVFKFIRQKIYSR